MLEGNKQTLQICVWTEQLVHSQLVHSQLVHSQLVHSQLVHSLTPPAEPPC